MHAVVATIAMDSMDAKETWPARRRKLDPNLKTSPPNNGQTFSTGASSSSSSSIEMTMVFVSVNTKSTTTSIATTAAAAVVGAAAVAAAVAEYEASAIVLFGATTIAATIMMTIVL